VVQWLSIWLCHPDPTRRPGHHGNPVHWAEKALLGWKHRLERGEMTMEDIDAVIEAKRRKWDRRAAVAKAEAEGRARAKAEAEEAAKARAREDQLRATWGRLPEPEREEIRAKVKGENPGLVRWEKLLEPLYLAELEGRQAAEPPEPPRRE
jgi:hypothetical protein